MEERNFSYTDSYSILIGNFQVQSHGVHFTTSNQFLIHPVLFLDMHFNRWLSTTKNSNIIHCSRPPTAHIQQYIQVPRLL